MRRKSERFDPFALAGALKGSFISLAGAKEKQENASGSEESRSASVCLLKTQNTPLIITFAIGAARSRREARAIEARAKLKPNIGTGSTAECIKCVCVLH